MPPVFYPLGDGEANLEGIRVGITVGVVVLLAAIITCVVIACCVCARVRAAVSSSRRSHTGSSSTTYPQATYPQSYTATGTDTIDKQVLLPTYTESTTDAYPDPYPSQPENTYPPEETSLPV